MCHATDCQAAIDARSRDIAEWLATWPNHCKRCHGWGGSYSTYDPSPSGVSLGSGTMTDFDTCPDCSEHGLCPGCGGETYEPTPDTGLLLKCHDCSWTNETPGCPEPAECSCWTMDEPGF